MKILFESLETFSEAPYFKTFFLAEQHSVNKNIGFDKVRERFMRILLRNALEFLEETINTNDFEDNQDRTDFRKKLEEFPILILPNWDKGGYQFIYLDDRAVDVPIKSLKLSQEISPEIQRHMNNLTKTGQLIDAFHRNALNVLKN